MRRIILILLILLLLTLPAHAQPPGLWRPSGTAIVPALARDVVVDQSLGVGTSSLDGILHLDNGTSDTDLVLEKDAGTNARLVFHNAGVEEANIRYNNAERLIFEVDAANEDILFRINDGGVDNDILKLDAGSTTVEIDDPSKLFISTSSGYALEVRKETTTTNSTVSALSFGAVSSGDMVENFGGNLNFAVADAVSGQETVAQINWKRGDSDDSGKINFNTWDGGSERNQLRITQEGDILVHNDSQKVAFGQGGGAATADDYDAYLEFDGDSLNIVANDETGTDELNITADGVHVTLGSAAASDFTVDTSSLVVEGDTGYVGIGTTSPDYALEVESNALDITDTWINVVSTVTKTDGATDDSDDLNGFRTNVTMNDADSTIGNIYGFFASANLTAGTLGKDAFGCWARANLDSGSVDDAVGMKVIIDQEAGNTADDIQGIHIQVDADGTVTNDVMMIYLEEKNNVDYGIYQDGTAENYFGGPITVNAGDAILTQGAVATTPDATTLGVGATTMAVDTCVVTVTGDGGGNTVATITGGVSGQLLTLIFVDANVTITDTDAHTANTVDCAGTATDFTSADDTVLQLVFDGTSWYEVSRSVN